jgi:hypothetical protein
VDVEHRAAQWQGERAAIEAKLTELHHHKSALEIERVVTVDLTKAWARARAIVAAINREGVPCPTFIRASQNMAVAAALLDTLPAPFGNGVDRVYGQLKDILGVTTVQ